MRADRKIAVIGGGPAGATCARRLSSSGRDVTLFEEHAAAEKPCGGGIPAHALPEFPELDDPSLLRRVVRDVLVYSPSDRVAAVPIPHGIHMFRRSELDAFLRLGAAGSGTRLVRARVRSVRRVGRDGWELATDTGTAGPFALIVGADGVRSVVRRAVARPYSGAQLTLALYAYVSGVARSEMVLKFFHDIDGYLWAFPRMDHVSVGICATYRSVDASRLADALYGFVERHYPEGRVSRGGLKGYFIPFDADPPAPGPAAGNDEGWALIGDAAGFVDPLTREGISWAMRSAAAFADRLARDGIALTPRMPEHLIWAHRHRAGFYRGEFLESMTRLAGVSPAIRTVLADLLEGSQGYGRLKRRLVLNALPAALQTGLAMLAGIVRPGRHRGQAAGP